MLTHLWSATCSTRGRGSHVQGLPDAPTGRSLGQDASGLSRRRHRARRRDRRRGGAYARRRRHHGSCASEMTRAAKARCVIRLEGRRRIEDEGPSAGADRLGTVTRPVGHHQELRCPGGLRRDQYRPHDDQRRSRNVSDNHRSGTATITVNGTDHGGDAVTQGAKHDLTTALRRRQPPRGRRPRSSPTSAVAARRRLQLPHRRSA